jgi:hypothetical protein
VDHPIKIRSILACRSRLFRIEGIQAVLQIHAGMNSSAQQLAFDLAPKSSGDLPPVDGLDGWRETRKLEQAGMAGWHGLPIGRHVRVDFANSPSLEGMLFAADPSQQVSRGRRGGLTLRIGTSVFRADEISACVALDWEV